MTEIKKQVIIVGAGIIGINCAYQLSKSGDYDIFVIDKNLGPGLETSYANGGQISVSHAEPWANPSAPFKILKWMFKKDAPLLFRPKLDWKQWKWCLQFLFECLPFRTNKNIKDIVRLGTYSRDTLREIRKEEGLVYDQLSQGILHFYTDQKEFELSDSPTSLMRTLGCDRRKVSKDECYAIESSLQFTDNLVGGTFTSEDESGDAYKFTVKLASIAKKNGVKFLYNTTIRNLNWVSALCNCVEVESNDHNKLRNDVMFYDHLILATGTDTVKMLEPIGIELPIYPTKGYSATIKLSDEASEFAPVVSLTDDEHKIVFSRLGNRLRIAGTAELNGYDKTLNLIRCKALIRRAHDIFPEMMKFVKDSDIEFWTGLRPSTPSNVPLIGTTKKFGKKIIVASGHGTLGWTEGCGTGKIVASIVEDKVLEFKWDTNLKV